MSLDIEIFSLTILINVVKQEDSKVGVHPTRVTPSFRQSYVHHWGLHTMFLSKKQKVGSDTRFIYSTWWGKDVKEEINYCKIIFFWR